MITYSCPPVEALNNCTTFTIENRQDETTTFLFYKLDKKFRLKLKNSYFQIYRGFIEFDFQLKGKPVKFLAIEENKSNNVSHYMDKAFKHTDYAFKNIDKAFNSVFGDKNVH